MTTAIAAAVDASVIVALALVACRACRRRSASLRHAILAASLLAAAAAPVFELVLPRWEFPLLSRTAHVPASRMALTSDLPPVAVANVPAAPATPRLTVADMLWAVWGTGVLLVIAGLLASLVRLFALIRRCRPTQSSEWRERAQALSMHYGLSRPVVVLESRDRSLLVTCGLFQPRIIVPAGAAAWRPDRIEVVLAHELAHIVRRDWPMMIAARAILAVYWFNPLMWIACRRMRDESEHACDDAVLRRGVSATDYASHLLAIARQVLPASATWASAPAVVTPSTLERRIAAMFNGSRNHGPLTRASLAATLLAIIVVSAPITAVTLVEKSESPPTPVAGGRDITLATRPAPAVPPAPAQLARRAAARPTPPPVAAMPEPPGPQAAAPQTPASLSGVVRDATGAVVPGVRVTLSNTAAKAEFMTTTDASGRFLLRNLPPLQYELSTSLPGFARILETITLVGGQDLERSLTLRIGGVTETVVVMCSSGTAAVPRNGAAFVYAFERGARVRALFERARARAEMIPALAAQTPPVRVGGSIFAPRKIQDVTPVCPTAPAPPGGVVILEAVVGVDGLIRDVTVLRAGPPSQSALVDSAREAVRQWLFTPTRLNNVPVPVIATISVTFVYQ